MLVDLSRPVGIVQVERLPGLLFLLDRQPDPLHLLLRLAGHADTSQCRPSQHPRRSGGTILSFPVALAHFLEPVEHLSRGACRAETSRRGGEQRRALEGGDGHSQGRRTG